MAFNIDPVEFLAASRKANAAERSKVSDMNFLTGGAGLFPTAKRSSRTKTNEEDSFQDLGGTDIAASTATQSLFEDPIDNIQDTVKTIGLMNELDVKKYGAEKQAEEMRRREALARAQCKKSKRGGLFGSIGSIIGGIATGNYGAAIAGGANLLGGSGGC